MWHGSRNTKSASIEKVNAMTKRTSTRLGWAELATGIDARRSARSEVRAYAKARGITPARQQAPRPKRAQRRRTADQQHGPVRSLSREEIARLGYESTKPVEAPKGEPVTVMNWRRGRKLSPDW